MKKPFVIVASMVLAIQFASAQQFPEKAIQKKLKANKIEIINAEKGIFKARNKKTKKWGVYEWSPGQEEFNELLPCAYDSVSWFQGYKPFIVLKNNNQYGIMLNPNEVYDAIAKIKFSYEAIRTKEREGAYYAVAKKNGKWGLVDWFYEFTVVEHVYNNPNDVPLIHMEQWQYPIMKKAQAKLEADLIIFDGGNGDGVFKARSKTTYKWGMFQSSGDEEYTELIPMQYDSLNFFPFNGKFTAVYNQGKIGFYLSMWSYYDEAKQTVLCMYDDYQRYTVNNKSYLAVKKNGKWGWVDWLTGEEKSDFVFETKDDLPYPSWVQSY